jgi:hypothetical protein
VLGNVASNANQHVTISLTVDSDELMDFWCLFPWFVLRDQDMDKDVVWRWYSGIVAPRLTRIFVLDSRGLNGPQCRMPK